MSTGAITGGGCAVLDATSLRSLLPPSSLIPHLLSSLPLQSASITSPIRQTSPSSSLLPPPHALLVLLPFPPLHRRQNRHLLPRRHLRLLPPLQLLLRQIPRLPRRHPTHPPPHLRRLRSRRPIPRARRRAHSRHGRRRRARALPNPRAFVRPPNHKESHHLEPIGFQSTGSREPAEGGGGKRGCGFRACGSIGGRDWVDGSDCERGED